MQKLTETHHELLKKLAKESGKTVGEIKQMLVMKELDKIADKKPKVVGINK